MTDVLNKQCVELLIVVEKVSLPELGGSGAKKLSNMDNFSAIQFCMTDIEYLLLTKVEHLIFYVK